MNKQQSDTGASHAAATARELRLLVGKLRRKLREYGNMGDFTPSQLSVLGRLERDGPATVTTLAHAEGVRPQSMGATVSALEAVGFVSGAADPSDGRQTILSLTAASKKWIKASRAAREDWLFHAIQTKLAPGEQKELAMAVELIKRLVDS